MHKDYISGADAARIPWFTNLKEKIAIIGPTLGLTPAQILIIQNACTNAINKINAVTAARTALDAALAAKNGIDSGELATIRTEVARWKTHVNYTPTLGETLGIVGASLTLDADNYKAQLTGKLVGNVGRLKFKKLGADGVNIYWRPKGSLEWRFLARDTRSPYDVHFKPATPGVPETWEFRAFGVKDDVEIGQPSDIVELVFGG